LAYVAAPILGIGIYGLILGTRLKWLYNINSVAFRWWIFLIPFVISSILTVNLFLGAIFGLIVMGIAWASKSWLADD
jgi:hypothetical protein